MRKATYSLIVTLALAAMFVLSTAVAMAGWGYDDCPPASTSGTTHASDRSGSMVSTVEPPNNSNADVASNPGNK